MNEFNKRWTAIGLVVAVFLAAMEGSIVATAMPEVIKDLGGEHLYALPFSMYLLTTTISSPIWGKLSDIFGRKIIYVSGVILFRSEEHTSELQSRGHLVCRLLLEK